MRAVGSLDAEEQTLMRDALHHVLTTVAASGRIGTSVFARTGSTSWWNMLRLNERDAVRPRCRLFGVPIQPDDGRLLFVHFEPKSDHREGTMINSALRSAERTRN